MERKLQPDTINQNSPTKQDNRKKGNTALKDESGREKLCKCFLCVFPESQTFRVLLPVSCLNQPWLLLGTDGKIIKSSVVIYTNPPLE